MAASVRTLASLIGDGQNGGGAGGGGTPRELAEAFASEQGSLVAAVHAMRSDASLRPANEQLGAVLVEERTFLGGWSARLRGQSARVLLAARTLQTGDPSGPTTTSGQLSAADVQVRTPPSPHTRTHIHIPLPGPLLDPRPAPVLPRTTHATRADTSRPTPSSTPMTAAMAARRSRRRRTRTTRAG